MLTTVEIDYDCGNNCHYAIPTTLRDDQSALRSATLIDTLAALADAQHERECPDLTAATGATR